MAKSGENKGGTSKVAETSEQQNERRRAQKRKQKHSVGSQPQTAGFAPAIRDNRRVGELKQRDYQRWLDKQLRTPGTEQFSQHAAQLHISLRLLAHSPAPSADARLKEALDRFMAQYITHGDVSIALEVALKGAGEPLSKYFTNRVKQALGRLKTSQSKQAFVA